MQVPVVLTLMACASTQFVCPGLVAHQEVIFGNQGEGLTLRHDSYDRSSFMTGVNLGIKEVVKRHELVYGLEHLL